MLLVNRAGELSAAELEQLMVIVANPRTFKIPDWFLNRQKDHKDGKNSQLTSSALDTKLREDLERLKKIRCSLEASLHYHASHSSDDRSVARATLCKISSF